MDARGLVWQRRYAFTIAYGNACGALWTRVNISIALRRQRSQVRILSGAPLSRIFARRCPQNVRVIRSLGVPRFVAGFAMKLLPARFASAELGHSATIPLRRSPSSCRLT